MPGPKVIVTLQEIEVLLLTGPAHASPKDVQILIINSNLEHEASFQSNSIKEMTCLIIRPFALSLR